MEYSAILSGKVNNEDIIVTGIGTILNGITKGDYILERIPKGFDSQVLKGLLITGYPNATHSIDNSSNIFQGKSYSYKRILTFNNGGKLEMVADCELKDNHLKSIFYVNGSIECQEEIINCEPIIEIWQPTKTEVLSGLFRITWKTKSGSYLSADASSEYYPKGVSQKQPILHRYIEISSKTDGKKYSLLQNSMLFHKLKID